MPQEKYDALLRLRGLAETVSGIIFEIRLPILLSKNIFHGLIKPGSVQTLLSAIHFQTTLFEEWNCWDQYKTLQRLREMLSSLHRPIEPSFAHYHFEFL